MSDLVHNERVKLLANALDRASTASVTIGFIAPVAGAIYSIAVPGGGWFALVVGAIVWIFVAVGLHWLARRALGGLRS